MAKNTVRTPPIDEEVLHIRTDFSAVWCPPCRPAFEELAYDTGRVKLAKLDVDQQRRSSATRSEAYRPCSFSRTAKSQDTVVGAAAKGQLVQKLDAVLQAS